MKNKKGISLIVLVITIIVMIILAASVIISISNTGIIDKANQAVNLSNEKQVQDLATLVWSEAYMSGLRDQELIDEVTEQLDDQGVTSDKWEITISNSNISVAPITLGYLLNGAADYGKTVNYEANGVTDWKVFYHTDNYVYLIASEALDRGQVPTGFRKQSTYSYTMADGRTRRVEQISWLGTVTRSELSEEVISRWMAESVGFSSTAEGSQLVDETLWKIYKNQTATYKDYVIGAIGTPTLEMFVASWNARREVAIAEGDTETYNIKLGLKKNGTNGYYINDITENDTATTSSTHQTLSGGDSLYFWDTPDYDDIWLAAPMATSGGMLYKLSSSKTNGITTGYIGYHATSNSNGVRPVVCLSSKIPAKLGTEGTTDFII